MSNFSKNLENATDEELINWINNLNFQVVPLASDELTRRTLRKLQKTIEKFNYNSSKQTEKMIGLTRWIVILTIAMLMGIALQIFLVFYL